MKKNFIYIIMAMFTLASFTACSEDEGTEPGNDSKPMVTLYSYSASLPYNTDNDVRIRFAINNKVQSLYYLSEKTTEKESRVASLGEDGYADYVVSNGTKVEFEDGELNTDVYLTDIIGAYTITAVAVNGSTKTSASTTFEGLEWEDVVTGTYYFNTLAKSSYAAYFPTTSTTTTLQVCTTNETLYRFKDLFGEGYSVKINLLSLYGKNSSGTYTYFRVPEVETPWTFGNYGAVSIKDIGYWQGSSSYVTDNGYESGMYDDYSCFIMVAYTVSAGSLAYGYDSFIPDAE